MVSSATMTAAAYQRRTTEAEMRKTIADLVKQRQGRLWFVRDSRASPETEDAPDLLILCPCRDGSTMALWIELKSRKRIVTAGQKEVAALMATVTRFVGGTVRPNPREGEMAFDDLVALLEAA